jgi:hypothetical protein
MLQKSFSIFFLTMMNVVVAVLAAVVATYYRFVRFEFALTFAVQPCWVPMVAPD